MQTARRIRPLFDVDDAFLNLNLTGHLRFSQSVDELAFPGLLLLYGSLSPGLAGLPAVYPTLPAGRRCPSHGRRQAHQKCPILY